MYGDWRPNITQNLSFHSYLPNYTASRFRIPHLDFTSCYNSSTPRNAMSSRGDCLVSAHKVIAVYLQHNDNNAEFQHVGHPPPGDGSGWGQCEYGWQHGSKPNGMQPPAEGRCNGEWLLLYDKAPNIRPPDPRGLWNQTLTLQPHSTLPGYEWAPILRQRYFIHRLGTVSAVC
jgi:hypothetical protein